MPAKKEKPRQQYSTRLPEDLLEEARWIAPLVGDEVTAMVERGLEYQVWMARAKLEKIRAEGKAS